ncbi:MAG TPA: hypothetical protein PKC13_08050 [Blastocatellia bacterium]|nr:hypothetical protein [Blastocatellia bacterium]HMY72791.1 hypothetical protein [Blastocatellia bacterium]
MKRMLVLSGVLAALIAMAMVASAQGKGANFAGTWELDKGKSQLPQMMADMIQSMTWTVTQDDKQLSRDQKMERNPNAQPPGGGGGGGGGGRGGGMMGGGGPLTVKLDGSESVSESPRGKATTTAKWLDGGKILEIKTVTNASTPQGDFTLTTAEHWEVADGGKTLKVHRTQETPRGKQESTLVLTKK